MSGVPSAFLGPVYTLLVLVILFSEYRISGVPSAFILALVEVLVMPEGVVIVLDLRIVAPLFVMVDDLVIPAGLRIVLDFVVTLTPG